MYTLNAVIIHFKDLKISIGGISERGGQSDTSTYLFVIRTQMSKKNPQKKICRWVNMTLAKRGGRT